MTIYDVLLALYTSFWLVALFLVLIATIWSFFVEALR